MNRRAGPLLLLALLSWALLCAATWRSPQGLHYYDPVVQLQALQQYQRGETPAWDVRRRVDPLDLARDLAEPVGWWPPAIPALVAPPLAAGLPLGSAVRGVVIVVGAIGAAGWALWLTRFPLPFGWLCALAALVPWLRHGSSAFFRFSGDTLAFAAAPWLFLGLAALLARLREGRASPPRLAVAGLALGFAAWVKYSLAAGAAAALAALAWLAWTGAPGRRPLPCLAVLGLAFLAAPLALKLHHLAAGAPDPTGHVAPDNLAWSTALFALADPVLGLADAASPLYLVLVKFDASGLRLGSRLLAAAGLPGGLLLAWLLARSGVLSRAALARRPPAEALALLALPLFTALMIGLWLTSDAARDARLFIPVACASLPAVLVLGREAWPRADRLLRAALAGAALLYLALPLAYGPAYVFTKIAERRGVVTAAPGLDLPSLGVARQDALLAELAAFASPRAVWIVPDPEIALALPGRVITPLAGRSIAEDMRHIYRAPADLSGWRSTGPIELRVLADPGDAPPARPASIPGAHGWLAHPLAGGRKVLWTALLSP